MFGSRKFYNCITKQYRCYSLIALVGSLAAAATTTSTTTTTKLKFIQNNSTKRLHFIILISCVFLRYLIWSYKGCHTVAVFSWDNGITLALCMTNNPGKTYEAQATEMSMPKKEEGTKIVGTQIKDSPVMKSVNSKMEKAMKAYADGQKVIVLSLMDSGTVDTAANVYLTSYQKFNITNYLFISSGSKSCPSLTSEYPAIHCVQYVNDTDGLTASSFGTKAFVRKTHYKTQAVLEAVRLGFSVFWWI